jgi:tight adherence protein B
LTVLIFLAVSLGVMACGFIWSELSRRDEMRAIQRLGEELSKQPSEQLREPLFKSVAEFDLGAPLPPLAGGADSDVLGLGSEPRLFDSGSAAEGGPRSGERGYAGGIVRLRDMLSHAGIDLTPQLFLVICGGASVLLGVAGMLLQGWFTGVPGLLAGGAAPWLYLRRRLNQRHEKLLRQLPPAFDLMARVLRAGLSMPQALQAVAESFEEPIAGDFGRCQEEQKLGIFPEVSFRRMAERTGVLEVKIFVMALLIQRQTGGNLSDVLERLAGLIRDRLRVRNSIRTLTAEGRMQATVLLVLPLVMFLAMRFLNREYTDVLLDHPALLAATGGLMALGAAWIRRIIDIE